MPNWCENGITLRHADPAMIDRAMNSEQLLTEFLPTPQELYHTVSGGEEHGDAAHKAQQQANIKRYGFEDWYGWNLANWGTKWDFALENIDRPDPNTLTAGFCSAWSPPVKAYRRLEELGFEIEAYYFEFGNAFCGRYTTEYGEDRFDLEISGDDDMSMSLPARRLRAIREPERLLSFLQQFIEVS